VKTADKISIMLVDDHSIVRQGFKKLLESETDFQVISEVGSGLEAISKLAAYSPDIIIMDVSMPDMNGIETTRQILKDNPDSKIIALSIHNEKHYVLAMMKAGARGYLLKTTILKELLTAIRTVSEGNIYLSPDITEHVITSLVDSDDFIDSKPLDHLSAREREVLQMLAEGKNSAYIAKKLFISKKTVDSHKQHIMKKLDLKTIADLTKFALKHGITDLNF
jgi:DNA-binding NarL/FixJ family response regulator